MFATKMGNMLAKRANDHTYISYLQRERSCTFAKRVNNIGVFDYFPIFLCVQKVKVF